MDDPGPYIHPAIGPSRERVDQRHFGTSRRGEEIDKKALNGTAIGAWKLKTGPTPSTLRGL
jgi:hypothetical protein